MALNNNLINIIQQPPQGPLVVSNNFYNVEKILRLRLGEHAGDPNYKQFAEKLGELREKMGRSLSLV